RPITRSLKSSASRARCSAPTEGQLHQTSPQPSAPPLSTMRTSTIGRSRNVPNDTLTGVAIGTRNAKASTETGLIGCKASFLHRKLGQREAWLGHAANARLHREQTARERLLRDLVRRHLLACGGDVENVEVRATERAARRTMRRHVDHAVDAA